MSLASQTVPEASATELAPGAAFQATGLPDIPVFMGPAPRGPFTPTAFAPGDVASLVAMYGNGAAVKECAYAITKVATGFVFLRMITATVAGVLGAVTVSRTASGTAPTNTISGTPTDGADVVILYGASSGVTGTGPIAYQVSLNGGTTYGAVQALGTATSIVVLGVTLALGSGKTITSGDKTSWLQTVASSTVLPITQTGIVGPLAGPTVVTVTGTPNDAYEFAMKITNDGNSGAGTAIGTSGIQFQVSLDYGAPDPTWSSVTALGTATSISSSNGLLYDGPNSTESTGLTVSFSSGGGIGFATGDIFTFNTSLPTYDSAGQTAATTALQAWNGQKTWTRQIGPQPETVAASLDSIVTGWDATAQPSWSIVDYRDRATTETLAAWSARVDIEWTPFTSTRVAAAKGRARMTCPITGRNNRRSGVTPCIPRAMGAGGTTIATDWAEFDLGPLGSDVSLVDINNNLVEYNGYLDPTGAQMGALCLRTWPGYVGVYPLRMSLMAPAGDIGAIPFRRVMNVAKILEKAILQLQVVKNFRQYSANGAGALKATGSGYAIAGNIYEPDARNIDLLMNDTLTSGVFNPGYCSSIKWVTNRTPTSLGGGSWGISGKMQIVGLIYVVKADGTAQYVSATTTL